MKNLKKFVTLGTVSIMMLGLVACGPKDNNAPVNNATNNTTTEANVNTEEKNTNAPAEENGTELKEGAPEDTQCTDDCSNDAQEEATNNAEKQD